MYWTVQIKNAARIHLRWLWLALVLLPSQSFAQEILSQKVDFIISEMSKTDALIILEEAAEVQIVFDPSLLDPNKLVSIHLIDMPISAILEKIIGKQDLEYISNDNKIIIRTTSFEPYFMCGYVQEKSTGEGIINASVTNSQSHEVAWTNEYGYFSIEIKHATTDLTVHHDGNLSQQTTINNVVPRLIVALDQQSNSMVMDSTSNEPITPKAIPLTNSVPRTASWEQYSFSQNTIRNIHRSTSNNTTDEYPSLDLQWGGNHHHTSVYLDGVKLLRPYHALQQYAVINHRMVKKNTLQKQYIESKYASNISAAMNITTIDGSQKNLGIDLGANNYMGNLILDFPIVKNKAGMVISARGNYDDPWRQKWIVLSNHNILNPNTTHDFYDLYGKLWFNIKKRHKITLSHFQQEDRLVSSHGMDSILSYGTFNEQVNITFENKFGLNYNQRTSALSWRFEATRKLFMNTIVSLSDYDDNTNSSSIGNTSGNDLHVASYHKLRSQLSQIEGQVNFDYYHNATQHLKFGAQVDLRTLAPGMIINNQALSDQEIEQPRSFNDTITNSNREIRFYLQDHLTHNKWQFDVGISAGGLETKDRNFFTVEPRIGLQYAPSVSTNILLSYLRNNQFFQYLNTDNQSPLSGLLVTSNFNNPPETSNQLALVISQSISPPTQISASLYYKQLNNLSLWSNFVIYNNTDAYVTAKNWNLFKNAYDESVQGIDLDIKHISNQLKGMLHYGYMRSTKEIQTPLLHNKLLDANSHQVTVSIGYALTKHIEISGHWLFKSGARINPYPYHQSFGLQHRYPSKTITEQRDFLQDYHRLDLSLSYHIRKANGMHQLSLDLINAYNKPNETSGYINSENSTLIIYGQSIMPTIGYQFTWRK